jgi:uncharacterized protein (DUF4415 family)
MTTKQKLIYPTPEEDAEIQRGIDADPDTYELTDQEFKRLRPFVPRGRPRSLAPKVLVSIRYDADIVERFREGGDGWQTRMNDALRDWLRAHQAE